MKKLKLVYLFIY